MGTARGDVPPADRTVAPAVRRRAAELRELDLRAHAAGRIVRVLLAPEDALAACEYEVLERFGHAPLLVLGGPRGPRLERLVGERGLVLLAGGSGGDPELAAQAATELQARGLRVAGVSLCAPAPVAALAAHGIRLGPPLRAAFLAALGGWPVRVTSRRATTARPSAGMKRA